MKYAIWVKDLGWLEDSRTKDPKTDTYTSNPALWDSLRQAQTEAKELNTMWPKRTHHYEARKYKCSTKR